MNIKQLTDGPLFPLYGLLYENKTILLRQTEWNIPLKLKQLYICIVVNNALFDHMCIYIYSVSALLIDEAKTFPYFIEYSGCIFILPSRRCMLSIAVTPIELEPYLLSVILRSITTKCDGSLVDVRKVCKRNDFRPVIHTYHYILSHVKWSDSYTNIQLLNVVTFFKYRRYFKIKLLPSACPNQFAACWCQGLLLSIT